MKGAFSMAEEKRTVLRHNVIIESRERISVTGVLEVISFDEEAIITDTEMGVLIIRGTNLHVNRLNLDNGELEIDGEISNLHYEEQNTFSKGKSSFLGKLFK